MWKNYWPVILLFNSDFSFVDKRYAYALKLGHIQKEYKSLQTQGKMLKLKARYNQVVHDASSPSLSNQELKGAIFILEENLREWNAIETEIQKEVALGNYELSALEPLRLPLSHMSALGKFYMKLGHPLIAIPLLELACPALLEDTQSHDQWTAEVQEWVECYLNLEEMYREQGKLDAASKIEHTLVAKAPWIFDPSTETAPADQTAPSSMASISEEVQEGVATAWQQLSILRAAMDAYVAQMATATSNARRRRVRQRALTLAAAMKHGVTLRAFESSGLVAKEEDLKSSEGLTSLYGPVGGVFMVQVLVEAGHYISIMGSIIERGWHYIEEEAGKEKIEGSFPDQNSKKFHSREEVLAVFISHYREIARQHAEKPKDREAQHKKIDKTEAKEKLEKKKKENAESSLLEKMSLKGFGATEEDRAGLLGWVATTLCTVGTVALAALLRVASVAFGARSAKAKSPKGALRKKAVSLAARNRGEASVERALSEWKFARRRRRAAEAVRHARMGLYLFGTQLCANAKDLRHKIISFDYWSLPKTILLVIWETSFKENLLLVGIPSPRDPFGSKSKESPKKSSKKSRQKKSKLNGKKKLPSPAAEDICGNQKDSKCSEISMMNDDKEIKGSPLVQSETKTSQSSEAEPSKDDQMGCSKITMIDKLPNNKKRFEGLEQAGECKRRPANLSTKVRAKDILACLNLTETKRKLNQHEGPKDSKAPTSMRRRKKVNPCSLSQNSVPKSLNQKHQRAIVDQTVNGSRCCQHRLHGPEKSVAKPSSVTSQYNASQHKGNNNPTQVSSMSQSTHFKSKGKRKLTTKRQGATDLQNSHGANSCAWKGSLRNHNDNDDTKSQTRGPIKNQREKISYDSTSKESTFPIMPDQNKSCLPTCRPASESNAPSLTSIEQQSTDWDGELQSNHPSSSSSEESVSSTPPLPSPSNDSLSWSSAEDSSGQSEVPTPLPPQCQQPTPVPVQMVPPQLIMPHPVLAAMPLPPPLHPLMMPPQFSVLPPQVNAPGPVILPNPQDAPTTGTPPSPEREEASSDSPELPEPPRPMAAEPSAFAAPPPYFSQIMGFPGILHLPVPLSVQPVQSPLPPVPHLTEYGLLLAKICQQIEYYFSVDNLARDMYLRSKMDAEGFVSLAEICTFNRVKNLTTDPCLVLLALVSSQWLEVDLSPMMVPEKMKGDATLLPSPEPKHALSCRIRTRINPKQWVLTTASPQD